MASYYLNHKVAQQIVDKTMEIIGCNVNVFDANGKIIGSGDKERIGELHEGAILCISQARIVVIDQPTSGSLRGVKPGINMPLQIDSEIVGVIGLTGDPSYLRPFGELVCMSAEMMMEQTRLLNELAQESRLKEELVFNLIQTDEVSDKLIQWAKRLSIDLSLPRIAFIAEVDQSNVSVDVVIEELQQLQNHLTTPDKTTLFAIQSLNQLIVLMPALNQYGRWDIDEHKAKLAKLTNYMDSRNKIKIKTALGKYFGEESNSVAKSYQTAHNVMQIGLQRMPHIRNYFYQDLVLPVLLNGLHSSWEAQEFLNLLDIVKKNDTNGVLLKTLKKWFEQSVHMGEAAKALFIHRNTLEYRLNKISSLTKLDLKKLDDRVLLYIALQLDTSTPQK